MEEMTHKGWFLLCPVYIGDIEEDIPFIDERHVVFRPLWWLSEFLFDAYVYVRMFFDEDYMPEGFPVYITGEL